MLSPDEIASRQFLVSLRGYDRDEVSGFLRDVAQEYASLHDRVRTAEQELQQARAQGAAAYRGPDADGDGPRTSREAFQALGEETTRILVAAEESAQEIRHRATDQARRELDQARREAREAVEAARRSANKLVTEAERRRDEVAAEMRQLDAARERFMQDLRGAVDSVRSAVGDLGEEEPAPEPGISEEDAIRRVVAPEGRAQDGDDLVADLEHVDPHETTELALADDDTGPVAAAVAASPETDEAEVDDALEEAPTTDPAADEVVTEPDEPAEEPPGPDPIALRTDALTEVRPSMLRRLKRALQDVQNGVLDAIRRHADEGGPVERLLPREDDLAATGEVAGVFLTAAYQAGLNDGAAMVGAAAEDVTSDGSRVPATSATFRAILGHEITSSLSATLRAGLEAGEPETSLSERVGEVFRDLKGPVIESVVDEQLVRVYGYGVLDAWESLDLSDTKTWVVGDEPRCPANQCHTNANEGAVALRDPFPSGEQVPPAHDACTCALAPTGQAARA